MIALPIKAMSVNDVWTGKRFKTQAYRQYEKIVSLMLPVRYTLPEKPYKLSLIFGFYNSLSDIDNPVKPFQDILQKKYGFNDRDISELHIRKAKTEKGKEYIMFDISTSKFEL